VVPISASQQFGAPLLEVDDDHSLKNSLPIILAEVRKLQRQVENPRTCKRPNQQKVKDQ
jgi:hypothetical protein